MNSISAIIITLNEENNIERCIKSLVPVADEIIVVDSFSTDRTKEICESYNVNFIEKKWEGYSATKNYANSLAKADYIFSIDADEALSPELTKSLADFKQAENTQEAYEINRLTNYCGKWIKHGGWYPDRKTRLWKTGIAEWKGDIHEDLQFKIDVLPAKLNGDLYHYTFHTIHQHEEQVNKFSSIAAENKFKKGRTANGLKIFLFPKWKFFRDFIIKLGFLDGYYGYIICKLSAHETFLRYSKLKDLQKKG